MSQIQNIQIYNIIQMDFDTILKQKTHKIVINLKREANNKQIIKMRKRFVKQKISQQAWIQRMQQVTINLQDILNQQTSNEDKIQEYFEQIGTLLKYYVHKQYIDSNLPSDVITSMKIYPHNQNILKWGYMILMNLSSQGIQVYIQIIPFICLKTNNIKLIDYFICTLINVIHSDNTSKTTQYIASGQLVQQLVFLFGSNKQIKYILENNLLQFSCILLQKYYRLDLRIAQNTMSQLLSEVKKCIFQALYHNNKNYYVYLKYLINCRQEIPQQFIHDIESAQLGSLKINLLNCLTEKTLYYLSNKLIQQLVENLFTKAQYTRDIFILLSNNLCNRPSSHHYIINQINKSRKSLYNQLKNYPNTINFIRLFRQSKANRIYFDDFLINLINAQGQLGVLEECINLLVFEDEYLTDKLKQMGFHIQFSYEI